MGERMNPRRVRRAGTGSDAADEPVVPRSAHLVDHGRGGVDDALRAHVAGEVGGHLVHHVAHRQLPFRLRHPHRAAEARMTVRARPGEHAEHGAGHEAHAERGGDDEAGIGLAGRGDRGARDLPRGVVDQLHTIHRAQRRGVDVAKRQPGPLEAQFRMIRRERLTANRRGRRQVARSGPNKAARRSRGALMPVVEKRNKYFYADLILITERT